MCSRRAFPLLTLTFVLTACSGQPPAATSQPTAAATKPAAPADQAPAAPATGKDALLRNLHDQNSYFNNDQRTNYRNLLKNPTQGVKAQKAF